MQYQARPEATTICWFQATNRLRHVDSPYLLPSSSCLPVPKTPFVSLALQSPVEREGEREREMNLPFRSPIGDTEHPQSPLRAEDQFKGSPNREWDRHLRPPLDPDRRRSPPRVAEDQFKGFPTREWDLRLSAPLDPDRRRSPLREAEDRTPPPPHNTPDTVSLPPSTFNLSASRIDPPPPPPQAAARMDGLPAAARVDGLAATPSKVVSWIVGRDRRAAAAFQASVAARALAAALCLVAFAVMAADKNKGWTLDSYDRYREYQYCVAVNVIGFLYSGFQVYALVRHSMTGKHIIQRQLGSYFDLSMDQILAYLLISASSAATARTDDWVSNWGPDPFPNMARASAAISFLAFVAFAVSSIISAYNVFSRSL